jgi:WD40 repeat protein
LEGHAAAVVDVAFSPDGTRIVTASLDGTARVWSTATGELLFTTPIEQSAVRAATFSSDGSRIAVIYADGRILVLAIALHDVIEIARARVTRTFTDAECRTYLHVEACPA